MILDNTLNLLKSRYSDKIENLIIDDICFGVNLTAVKLSDGSAGVATTLLDVSHHCLKKDRDFGVFTPTKVIGQSVKDLFETNKQSSLVQTLRIAVLNAISQRIMETSNYQVLKNTDPVDLLDLESSEKTITIVGAFSSYIKKISETNNKLYVLEMDINEFVDEQKQYYVPAEDFGKVIPKSDIIIITGLTIVNNTLDNLLAVVPENAKVVITGPSSGLLPDLLFEKGVDIIGSSRIVNTQALFDLAAQFGKGYHLFEYCAEKICVMNPNFKTT